jgi:hypothetical protein
MDVRNQNWGDNLRLPTFVNSGTGDVAALLKALDPVRRSPIPFQSKHLPALKRSLWYALQRPADRARTGLLCLWPAHKCCVYVSGDAPTNRHPTPRVAVLRFRVDPQFYADGVGLTVFAATLSPATRRLVVEDVLLWKGRPVAVTDTFGGRWSLAAQWIEHFCIVDGHLVDGLDLVLARWKALEAVKPEGVWVFQSDETDRRPLIWLAGNQQMEVPESPGPRVMAPHLDVMEEGSPVGDSRSVSGTGDSRSGNVSGSSSTVTAIRETGTGPDQWRLVGADGADLGRALIRKLDVSSALRELTGDRVRVEVAWNDGFGKWEVKGMAQMN